MMGLSMGLADRKYMRDEYHPPQRAKQLIWVLIIAFVIQSCFYFYGDADAISQLGLTVDGIRHGKIWQLITFQFLHSVPVPWHVLFNCLGLYFFGRPVEERFGSKRFLQLYLLSGVIGGLVQVLCTAVLPRHVDIPVVGASAGVCGMIAIFCSLYPMHELTTWIYFFPVMIRARWLLIFLTGFSIYGTLVPFTSVAHAAHLGGIVVGIIFVRWGRNISESVSRFLPSRPKAKVELLRSGVSAKKLRLLNPSSTEAVADEYISKEIDPILDKISAKGFQSLTDRERQMLDAARKRLER
jgi:membrane associated rhomboid family serine protease